MSSTLGHSQIPSPYLRQIARQNASSGPQREVLAQRAEKRERRARERAETRERLKQEKGNELFRDGCHTEAAEKYEQALQLGGRKAVILNNLSITYLKLKLYEQAEEAATEALIYDPKNVKARYRRGLARKELGRANGAAIDFEIVVKHDNRSSEAGNELNTAKKAAADGANTPSDDEYTDEEYSFPRFDQNMDEYNAVSDSESSDCEHKGNGTTCRFYNHGGCNRGTRCQYSHAPDDRSIRDDLGRNVCIFSVVGLCQYGPERCIYSHDATFLPEKGWWNDPDILTELNSNVYMARSIKRTEKYIVEMIHGFLYDAGYGPPRNLDAILDRSILSHTAFHKTKDSDSQNLSTTPTQKFILFLALEHENSFQSVYGGLVDAVRARLETRIVSNPSVALDLMYSPKIVGVFIADAGIMHQKHSKLMNAIVEFTRNGGISVYGGMFPSMSKPTEITSHFTRVWNFPWKSGSYTRQTLKRNGRNETVLSNPSLPQSYSIKALYVSGVAPNDAMYMVDGRQQVMEAPVVHAKFSDGYLGYIGDVNGEEDATESVLAMFGLLDHSYDSPTPLNPRDKPTGIVPKPPPTFSQDFVLLVSLVCEPWFMDMYGEVYSALRKKVHIKQAFTPKTALSYMDSPNLVGIFITDFGIADTKHSQVLQRIVQYTKDGGLVVAAGQFSGNLCGPDDQRFFRAWGLSWKRGSYHRTTFQKNQANELVKLNPSLPQSYSMKALHMAGIGQEDAVYTSTSDSRLESLVWAPTPITNHDEAPAVQVRVGRGYFGYIGDVNTEDGTTSVLLAMLGLLDHKYDTHKSTQGENGDSNSGSNRSASTGPSTQRTKQTARKTTSLTQPVPAQTTRQYARKTTSSTQPVAAEAPAPTVLVIHLSEVDTYSNENHQLLSDTLANHSRLIRAPTMEVALRELSSPNLKGVLINEPSIATVEAYADILEKVIAYARRGGSVVFGGSFSSLASPRLHDEFWRNKMGIEWSFGSYRTARGDVVRQHELFRACSWLESSLSVQAVYLKSTDKRSILYRNTNDEGAALRSRYGEGYVSYVGGVHGTEKIVEVTLAMLGVITNPLPRVVYHTGLAVVEGE
ncbi:hypothetical protein VNI00_011073 [Paramarasmius palmivorus]|uniref:C3H1-type domain-containing protein n=1 Tax=Paramarasmius palmivorus TaxID=297713 RepID=A0AAW0CGX0_9AGAR